MTQNDNKTNTVSQYALEIKNVKKTYQIGNVETPVLHGISFNVQYGEMVAVMGQSGSGKSTLLYCLSGLEPVSDGAIMLAGKPLNSYSRAELAQMRRSDVGFVFQSYNLIPTLTALENAALPYRLRRQRPPFALIEETFTKLGLNGRSTAYPPLMSGGEQQRVALARVLAQQPKVVFADEPTGALDTKSAKIVLEELQTIAHNNEQCVLVVTHDPLVAAQCDRVIFMKDGCLASEIDHPNVDQVTTMLTALLTDKAA